MKLGISRISIISSILCTFLFSLFPVGAASAVNKNRSDIGFLRADTDRIFEPRFEQNGSFTVTRGDDRNNPTCIPGDCSLREAVNAANASAADDSINFAPGVTTISLLSLNEIKIYNNGSLAIMGPGADRLTIAPSFSRAFRINQATVTISGLTISGGRGVGSDPAGFGGAIYADGGALTLDGVQVTGSSAEYYGGGVYFHYHYSGNNGTHRIINSTISGNYGYYCGGFYNDGTVVVVNSTISGNYTAQFDLTEGGGFCNGPNGDTTLRNVTLTDNTSDIGGGIFLEGGRLDLGNTIVAGNQNTSGPNCYCLDPEIYSYQAAIVSTGGNLIGDLRGYSPSYINYRPSDIRNQNPMLGPLQNNGGSTPTRVPLAGSPIIDRGLNSVVSPISYSTDQRGIGFSRFRDGNGDGIATVDIGATEAQFGVTGTRPGAFDFDGDGRADISVFRPSDRTWYLDRSQTGFAALQFGLATDKIAPADYDGDGKTDVAVYRPSEGTWYILNSSNSSITATNFGIVEDVPVPGDFDGDGKADVAIFRPSTGTWWLNRTAAGITAVQYGLSGDAPLSGDFDGDGKVDLAVFRPSNSFWYIQRSAAGEYAMQWGIATDKVVPADYDGDGRADIAVYRPSQGAWYVVNSSNLQYSIQVFGVATDIPAPGDYDGDGKTDLAIFRPSNGQWWLERTTAGLAVKQFGLNGDMPLPDAFGN